MTPDFKIGVASFNDDATNLVKRRLFHLQVKKNVKGTADSFEINLSDINQQLIIPPVGDEVTIYIGYSEKGELTSMGTYTVDEVGLKGPPDALYFSGSTEKTSAGMNNQVSKSWDAATLLTVVESIAQNRRNKKGDTLKAHVDKSLKDIWFDHLDQVNETDTAFLVRLARRVGGFYNSDGHTIGIYEEDQGYAREDGTQADPVTLSLRDLSNWQLAIVNKSEYDHVRVWSRNPNSSTDNSEPKYQETYYPDYTPPASGTDTGLSDVRIYTIQDIQKDTETARKMAEHKYRDLKHQSQQLTITLPGRADLVAGAHVHFTDARPELMGDDGQKVWILNEVSHRLDTQGYVTSGSLWQPMDSQY
ncbi:contractile injection system protein, VgrG/Pvc8 family [Endozoicomonas sp. 4G]|uniref:contractile injection system protein, VgrG/Pvc8 family n=1 Tax=Endozoicomonas sp. 4G TaxID=2872754 RepID=UPI0020788590|nr:contractile injection system protein, VgrG/Pvc8 family [Endozoicomonas sp. 4G]